MPNKGRVSIIVPVVSLLFGGLFVFGVGFAEPSKVFSSEENNLIVVYDNSSRDLIFSKSNFELNLSIDEVEVGLDKKLESDIETTYKKISDNVYKYGYIYNGALGDAENFSVKHRIIGAGRLDINSSAVIGDYFEIDFTPEILSGAVVDIKKDQDNSAIVTITTNQKIIDPVVIFTDSQKLLRGSWFARNVWNVSGYYYVFYFSTGNPTLLYSRSSMNGTSWNPESTVINGTLGSNQDKTGPDWNGTDFLFVWAASTETGAWALGRPSGSDIVLGPYRVQVSNTDCVGPATGTVFPNTRVVAGCHGIKNAGNYERPTIFNWTGNTYGTSQIMYSYGNNQDDLAGCFSLNSTHALCSAPLRSGYGATNRALNFTIWSFVGANTSVVTMLSSGVQEGTTRPLFRHGYAGEPIAWIYGNFSDSAKPYSITRYGNGTNSISRKISNVPIMTAAGNQDMNNISVSIDNSTGRIYMFRANGTGIYMTNYSENTQVWNPEILLFSRTNADQVAVVPHNVTNGTHNNWPLFWREGGQDFVFDVYSEKFLDPPLPNTAPTWSNINNTPQQPVTQNPATSYIFNVTWSDDYDVEGYNASTFNSNHSGFFTNYTMFRYSGNTASINFTGLSVGTFVWWMTANDSSGAYNSTPQQTYVIEAAPTFTTLAIIGGGYYGDTTNTAQQYMSFFGDNMVSTEYSRQAVIIPTNGTVRKMYATKASGGSNVTFTLYKNGSPTDLTCNISSAGTSCSDLSNNATVAEGDTVAMGADLDTATPTGYFRFTVEVVRQD